MFTTKTWFRVQMSTTGKANDWFDVDTRGVFFDLEDAVEAAKLQQSLFDRSPRPPQFRVVREVSQVTLAWVPEPVQA